MSVMTLRCLSKNDMSYSLIGPTLSQAFSLVAQRNDNLQASFNLCKKQETFPFLTVVVLAFIIPYLCTVT